MRKFLATLLFLVGFASCAHAVDALVLTTSQGKRLVIRFREYPSIHVTEEGLEVKTPAESHTFVFSDYLNITFGDYDVVSVGSESVGDQQMNVDGDMVYLINAVSNSKVVLYNSAGAIIKEYKVDAHGGLSFSIANLSDGIYVIKTDFVSYKIIKK